MLHRLIFRVKESDAHSTPQEVLNHATLSNEARAYFKKLLDASEQGNFSGTRIGTAEKFKYDTKYFRELLENIDE